MAISFVDYGASSIPSARTVGDLRELLDGLEGSMTVQIDEDMCVLHVDVHGESHAVIHIPYAYNVS